MKLLTGKAMVCGEAAGELLYADVGLSFWGGVDARNGDIIDRHHPLAGHNLSGKVLAIPSGRGSCTGSSVVLELLLNGAHPVALLFEHPEEIITLGVVVADEIFGKSIPVAVLGSDGFAALKQARYVSVSGGRVAYSSMPIPAGPALSAPRVEALPSFALEDRDIAMLAGEQGPAAKAAMRIILRMAAIQGAAGLLDVGRAHIDGCVYVGPSSILFAEKLRDLGGKVAIPATLNAISVDERGWRSQGIAPAFATAAIRLAEAYVAMGASPVYTCAPYLLENPPVKGEQIAWAESNAVVFANSVLGARTVKYPDYLDICIALTGRAPLSGCHITANRRATVIIRLPELHAADDGFFALLGYHVGLLAPRAIPLVTGLETVMVSNDDLKSFSAAFATTSAAPMFHILGVTPEAPSIEEALGGFDAGPPLDVTAESLERSWRELNSASDPQVGAVCIGTPHLSVEECANLALLCKGRTKRPDIEFIATCGRHIHEKVAAAGILAELEAFGVRLVCDTCWCQIGEPLFPPNARTLMTNSGKYAHYGPGLIGRPVHFGSMRDCVDAACTGLAKGRLPEWLLKLQRHGNAAHR